MLYTKARMMEMEEYIEHKLRGAFFRIAELEDRLNAYLKHNNVVVYRNYEQPQFIVKPVEPNERTVHALGISRGEMAEQSLVKPSKR